jgi:hypothetical protein
MAPRVDGTADDAENPSPDPARDEPTADTSAPTPPEPDEVGAPRELSESERWDAIVAELADLDGTATAPTGPEDHGSPSPGSAVGRTVTFPVAPWASDPRVVRAAGGSAAVPPELQGRDWDGTGQIDDAEATVDAEEHFEPPDPGPVLGGDPLLTMAWFAAAGMPIFFFVLLVAWRNAPSALVQAAGVVFALGVAVLVWRMPNHRHDGPDDDHGAVV